MRKICANKQAFAASVQVFKYKMQTNSYNIYKVNKNINLKKKITSHLTINLSLCFLMKKYKEPTNVVKANTMGKINKDKINKRKGCTKLKIHSM